MLAALLDGQSPALRLRVLVLLRARGLAEFDPALRKIANANAESAALRLASIGALSARTSPLATNRFAYLNGALAGKDYAARSAAAQVIGRAKLSEAQQVTLADATLAPADGVALLAFVEAYRGGKSEAAGKAWVEALAKNKAATSVVSATQLSESLASYPEPVRAAAKPLLGKIEAQQAERIKFIGQMETLLEAGGFLRAEVAVRRLPRHRPRGRHAGAGPDFYRGHPQWARHLGSHGVPERELRARLRADARGDDE